MPNCEKRCSTLMDHSHSVSLDEATSQEKPCLECIHQDIMQKNSQFLCIVCLRDDCTPGVCIEIQEEHESNPCSSCLGDCDGCAEWQGPTDEQDFYMDRKGSDVPLPEPTVPLANGDDDIPF